MHYYVIIHLESNAIFLKSELFILTGFVNCVFFVFESFPITDKRKCAGVSNTYIF